MTRYRFTFVCGPKVAVFEREAKRICIARDAARRDLRAQIASGLLPDGPWRLTEQSLV